MKLINSNKSIEETQKNLDEMQVQMEAVKDMGKNQERLGELDVQV
jgi:hypothetical protein